MVVEVEEIPMRAGLGTTVDLPPPETTVTATVTVIVTVMVLETTVEQYCLPEMTVMLLLPRTMLRR